MTNRTAKGNVTSEAREKSGGKSGSYPVFDQKSCISAVKLRHHGKSMSASAVLSKASKWANARGNGP